VDNRIRPLDGGDGTFEFIPSLMSGQNPNKINCLASGAGSVL
jgi:hypothetical protein